MRRTIWFLVAVLVLLHQDYWQWDNTQLDFGFLPRAITYHVLISLSAAAVWVLAINFAWPAEAEFSRSEVAAEDCEP